MITEVESNVEQSLRTELAVVQKQAAITITDQASYDRAAEILTSVKTWRKRWEEYWKPMRESAHQTWKNICTKIKEVDDPAAAVEATVKRSLLAWDQEQERIQQERQRKADEEARKKAEADRAAAAVQAEMDGLSEEEIEAAVASVEEVPAPVVEPTYQKASGISKRDNWTCQVDDLKALCKAIGAGKVPTSYVLPNESALNARARADKSTMVLPGCKAVNNPIVSGRGR